MNNLEHLIAVEQFIDEVNKQKQEEIDNLYYMENNMMRVIERGLDNSRFEKGILSYSDLRESIIIEMKSAKTVTHHYIVTATSVLKDRWRGRMARIVVKFNVDTDNIEYISHTLLRLI